MNKSKVVNTKRDRRSTKNPPPSQSTVPPTSSFLTLGALVTGLSSSLGKMTEEIDVKTNPIVQPETPTLVHDDEPPTLSESSTIGDSGMSSDVTITNDDVSSLSIDDKQTKIAEIDSTTLKKGQNCRSSTESFDTQSINDVKPSTGKNKSKRTSLKKQLQNLLKIEKSSLHDDLPILDEQTNGKKSIINGKSSSTNKKNSTEDTSVNNGLLTDVTPIVENVRSSPSPTTSPRRTNSTIVKEREEEEVKPMSTGVSDSISTTTTRTSIRSSSVEAGDRQRSPARSYDTGLSSSYSVLNQTGNAQATDNLRIQHQREREELSELNVRFRGYLDRVKILENKNSNLTSQLDEISKTWGAASQAIINKFGSPLDRLRQELNDCMMDETDYQTGLRRSQQTIDHYRQLINDEAAWNDRQEEKREQLKLEFDHSCSELNSLKNSYKQAEDQIKYLLKQRDDYITKVDDLNERFYHSTIDRIRTDLQVQTLREEIPFLNDIYSHLLSEFEQLKPTNGLDAQLFYRQELEKAIRDIRRDFETLNNAQRKEMEDYYATKIGEMQNEAKRLLAIPSMGIDSSKISEQNKSKNDLSDAQKLLIQEKNNCKDLQDLLAKLEEEFAFVRDQRLDVNESINRELSQAQEKAQQLTSEIDAILRGNITLESEINIYRRLLDSETKRLTQQPVEPIIVPEPAPASFGSELGKVFNKKIKKGPISIKDCAPDGKCITLDNSSHDKDVDVSNWVLKRSVDGGQELSYTIPVGLVIQRGGELKIFARSAQNAHNRLPYQVVNDKLDSWGMGTECVTKLFSEQGEDKASHEQKIVFGSDSARTIPYNAPWPTCTSFALRKDTFASIVSLDLQLSIDTNNISMTNETNEFWNEKMKHLFYLYDADRDGSITPIDFEILANKLSSLVGQDDSKRREDYANARKTLCQVIMKADANNDGKVTLEEWLDFHQRLVKELQKPDTDPEILGQISDRINTTFHMLDLNHDGFIGKDEWIKTCQFFGVDEKAAEKSFGQITTGDKLEEDQAKQLFFQYLQSNDPNHVSNCCLCFL